MRRLKLAIQGEPGSYSEMAALKYSHYALVTHKRTFSEAFDAAAQGATDCAVVPVENSIEGSVNEVYDLLLQTRRLSAIAEIYQRVHHCLISNNSVSKENVKSAYSHPQALAQCRTYLQKKGIEPIATYDTAGAVKLIRDKKFRSAAAIASKRAAEYYNMKILEEGIEDRKNNFTRFLVLTRRKSLTHGDSNRSNNTIQQSYKTSIIFSVKHAPGALHKILGEFASRGINLTKVESRPTKEKPWEYNFYLDFEGTQQDSRVDEALDSLRKLTASLKIIGSYPRADFT